MRPGGGSKRWGSVTRSGAASTARSPRIGVARPTLWRTLAATAIDAAKPTLRRALSHKAIAGGSSLPDNQTVPVKYQQHTDCRAETQAATVVCAACLLVLSSLPWRRGRCPRRPPRSRSDVPAARLAPAAGCAQRVRRSRSIPSSQAARRAVATGGAPAALLPLRSGALPSRCRHHCSQLRRAVLGVL